MDPTPTASFIPRQSFSNNQGPVLVRHKTSLSVFNVLSVIIFIASIAASGAVFYYQRSLIKEVNVAKDALATEEKKFNTAAIADLKSLDAMFRSIKSVVDNHGAITPLFTFLQDKTMSAVNFQTLTWDANKDGAPTALLDGITKNFQTLALQSDELKQQSSVLQRFELSKIGLDDKGKVKFGLDLFMKKGAVLYGSTIPKSAPSQNTAPTTP